MMQEGMAWRWDGAGIQSPKSRQDSKAIPRLASRVLDTSAQQSGQDGPYLVTLRTLVGARGAQQACRATRWLHCGIYSKLGGKEGSKGRTRMRGASALRVLSE